MCSVCRILLTVVMHHTDLDARMWTKKNGVWVTSSLKQRATWWLFWPITLLLENTKRNIALETIRWKSLQIYNKIRKTQNSALKTKSHSLTSLSTNLKINKKLEINTEWNWTLCCEKSISQYCLHYPTISNRRATYYYSRAPQYRELWTVRWWELRRGYAFRTTTHCITSHWQLQEGGGCLDQKQNRLFF